MSETVRHVAALKVSTKTAEEICRSEYSTSDAIIEHYAYDWNEILRDQAGVDVDSKYMVIDGRVFESSIDRYDLESRVAHLTKDGTVFIDVTYYNGSTSLGEAMEDAYHANDIGRQLDQHGK